MLKSTKDFLTLCLIILQFIAPFIHAHAFGLDGFKEHTFHVHSSELGASGENEDFAGKTYLAKQQVIGAVVSVASGIKTSMADDIADSLAMMAILFAFVLLVFNGLHYLRPPYFQSEKYQQYLYVLQNPRAPPAN
jgi:hypothetical protein